MSHPEVSETGFFFFRFDFYQRSHRQRKKYANNDVKSTTHVMVPVHSGVVHTVSSLYELTLKSLEKSTRHTCRIRTGSSPAASIRIIRVHHKEQEAGGEEFPGDRYQSIDLSLFPYPSVMYERVRSPFP